VPLTDSRGTGIDSAPAVLGCAVGKGPAARERGNPVSGRAGLCVRGGWFCPGVQLFGVEGCERIESNRKSAQ